MRAPAVLAALVLGTSAPRTSGPGQEAARAETEAPLVAAHLLDLIHRDVNDPGPQETRSHGQESRTQGSAIASHRFDGADTGPRAVDAEALAARERLRHGAGSLSSLHTSMLQPDRAPMG